MYRPNLLQTIATTIVVLLTWPFSNAHGVQTHDFSADPITWNPASGPLSWDSDNDFVDDFQLTVVSGTIDSASGRYAIDNFATSDSGNIREFVFAFRPLRPGLDSTEINLLGFNFFSEKNIEPGGNGGAGSILADIFDDQNVELVNGINVSGSLGSNPSRVDIPGNSSSFSFRLAIDLDSPPNNDDAQVILGDFVFNGGSVRAFSSVPEPNSIVFVLAASATFYIRRIRKS